ncbi:ATP-dependent nuclease [Pseudomonas sp. CCI3.1]|uniref:ATP-dependent nuclease n=1 Tax=Pseudomonas sp. CCI3.1 TaxID=3048618 RepID=UPI002AB4DC87|nr:MULTISPECIES: AAA family ATPase [unclassified Pseudomonas]MDY7584752.1 AAA family ATPase [Pseudomonas sp. CCI3.1]MEB0066626.1 AAA family ATPase [Pseudomonas sp. CCI3.1]MEB0072007.1 AAA family ATPase [Pseudomonas sp. CCI1.4]
MKRPTASISQITFSGGDVYELKPNEKIILVGPNNSGKSHSLREIISICETGKDQRTVVVASLKISKEGDGQQLKDFLDAEAEYKDGYYSYKSWSLYDSHVQYWDGEYLLHAIRPGFIQNIAANDRLNICEQQASISPGEQKTKPQHILYDSEGLMRKVSLMFRRAFGKDLMFDFRGGSRLPIHVGELPKSHEGTDRVGDAYVSAVRENPLLDKQGDGMKSYAGILFEAIVADLDITLIDEPEAFLHPPQMRRLGETLSSEVRGQLIVSTHSSDILRGFLEGTRGDVRILRIRREGDKNMVSEASSDVIKELWEKPDLRYSNALEGMFHEQTIICEDDSDCRLINSIADHLESKSGEQWQDTAYVPTGGKHGIPRVAGVLRKIGVPVKAVFDIDFLSERSLVKSTVEAFGGNWTEIEPVWGRLDSAVRSGNKPKTASQIKVDIIGLLNQSGEEDLPKGDIIEAMKQGKSWNDVKKYGTRGIPNGNAQADFKLLRDKLECIGVYLVPAGEIENFCPEIGSHGPKFVTKLLSSIPLNDDRLSDLRRFVERVHKGPHSK